MLITVVIRGCVVSFRCLSVLWGFGDWPCFRPFVAVTLQHLQSLAVFVWSFCSRSSSLRMKLWVGVAASSTVEMHYSSRKWLESGDKSPPTTSRAPVLHRCNSRGQLANPPPPVAVKVSPGLLRFQPYPRPVFSFAVYSE
ncbi:hypothetical protein F2Q69_00022796 [Brassica cretica]|uniref:Uncharacterized protein n=1 Tax=Brassica cretica TaxID=69181 RepID=A0A8S9Q4R4_BRACR|nr:hypothetical protein F2Q69_00022796 [Brassica cretica]